MNIQYLRNLYFRETGRTAFEVEPGSPHAVKPTREYTDWLESLAAQLLGSGLESKDVKGGTL